MKQQQKNKLTIVLLLAAVIFITVYLLLNTREARLKREGEVLIYKLEEFRSENDRLPKNLEEIGETETVEGPLYYKKIDSSTYLLWFGTDLGESVTYHSTTKKWE